ncbi:MAG: ATP cone domain-containing protein [Nitrosotalea sp.]
MNQKTIWIIKANGARVPFNKYKLRETCIRAGASRKAAKRIADSISQKIQDDMKTSEIYKMVLNSLKIEDEGTIIRHKYRLKESIMQLGPAGYRFETFIGEILGAYGHNVLSIRAIVQGKCIHHEIDLITELVSSGEKYLIECKYHNQSGLYTGLKESLYTHARFLDLGDKYEHEMLICNTKLSDDARTYAQCIGQKIISWRYPPEKSLERMIEEKGLYPVTILGLNKFELAAFARNNMMLIRDLVKANLGLLSNQTGISFQRLDKLQSLSRQILR